MPRVPDYIMTCSMCKKVAKTIHGGEYAPGCFGACKSCADIYYAKQEKLELQQDIKQAKTFLRKYGFKVTKTHIDIVLKSRYGINSIT